MHNTEDIQLISAYITITHHKRPPAAAAADVVQPRPPHHNRAHTERPKRSSGAAVAAASACQTDPLGHQTQYFPQPTQSLSFHRRHHQIVRHTLRHRRQRPNRVRSTAGVAAVARQSLGQRATEVRPPTAEAVSMRSPLLHSQKKCNNCRNIGNLSIAYQLL